MIYKFKKVEDFNITLSTIRTKCLKFCGWLGPLFAAKSQTKFVTTLNLILYYIYL